LTGLDQVERNPRSPKFTRSAGACSADGKLCAWLRLHRLAVTSVTAKSIPAALCELVVLPRRRTVGVDQPEPKEATMLKRASMLALAAIAALASPIAVQAGNSGSRTQTQPAPAQTHPARHQRFPGMNHAPDVTLKRGAIGP